MATKTDKDKKKKSTAKTSVPTAKGGKPKSGGGLLKRLGKKATAKPKAASKSSKAKPVLTMSDEAVEALTEFAPVKELNDKFKERADELNKSLKEACWEPWLNMLWETKRQPESALCIVPHEDDKREDCTALFVMADTLKVNMPPYDADEDDPAEKLVEKLVDDGEISLSNATKLVENEINFTERLSLNLTELIEGKIVGKKLQPASAPVQAVAEKFLAWRYGEDVDGDEDDGPLDIPVDQRDLLEIERIFKPTVYANFLDRVCNYVESKDQLENLLRIIVPQARLTQVKYAASDSKADHNQRLLGRSVELIGDMFGVSLDDDGDDDEE